MWQIPIELDELAYKERQVKPDRFSGIYLLAYFVEFAHVFTHEKSFAFADNYL